MGTWDNQPFRKENLNEQQRPVYISGHIFMKTCCKTKIHTEENIFVHPTDFFIIEVGWFGSKKIWTLKYRWSRPIVDLLGPTIVCLQNKNRMFELLYTGIYEKMLSDVNSHRRKYICSSNMVGGLHFRYFSSLVKGGKVTTCQACQTSSTCHHMHNIFVHPTDMV